MSLRCWLETRAQARRRCVRCWRSCAARNCTSSTATSTPRPLTSLEASGLSGTADQQPRASSSLAFTLSRRKFHEAAHQCSCQLSVSEPLQFLPGACWLAYNHQCSVTHAELRNAELKQMPVSALNGYIHSAQSTYSFQEASVACFRCDRQMNSGQ